MNNNHFKVAGQYTCVKVLMVSEDMEIGNLWALILRERRYEVILASTIGEAINQWLEAIPDLVIIDISTNLLDPIELCQKLREESIAPILLLTPLNNETHLLEAYRAGVDECILKPVSPALFLAKAQAWLRRSWTVPAEGLANLTIGDLSLNPSQRQVVVGMDEVVKLTNLEFRLLHLLMSHPGWVLETDYIVERVWGYYGSGNSNLLKNVIYRLRRKIDPGPDQPRYIHTETGLGYKFQIMEAPVEVEASL